MKLPAAQDGALKRATRGFAEGEMIGLVPITREVT
jgi:hypothetical protein